ncbi:MAG: DUF1275 domain-containing protein [Bdellovibrionales bacterium]|nr:DUF1275 domain-containing protein [Bdellovibrionales bacterium]
MFTKNANQDVDTFIIVHWLLMSLCAGVLNAIAFIGLGTFATHVTGFGTLFGVNIAGFHFGNAIAALAVPMFFLCGSTISGLFVEARVRAGKLPHYDYIMYACSALLVIGAIIGSSRTSDQIPTYLHIQHNFVLLSLICLTSGLINAALSYSSRSTLRITHLTGVTTDLGRGIAEVISLKLRGIMPEKVDLRLNLIRTLTIVSFAAGGILGAFSFHWVAFKSLLIPAAYFIYAGGHGRKIKRGLVAP